jgi:hypothetical protein
VETVRLNVTGPATVTIEANGEVEIVRDKKT